MVGSEKPLPRKQPVESFNLDGGTQLREKLDDANIAEIARLVNRGVKIDPVVGFYDGKVLWLAHGFHRIAAHEVVKKRHILAVILDGTRQDAIRYAIAQNHKHGAKRTNADKRLCVLAALADPEWSALSNSILSGKCGVSDHTVATVRAELRAAELPPTDHKRPAAEPEKTPPTGGASGSQLRTSNGAEGAEKPAEPEITRVGRDGRRHPARKPRKKPPSKPGHTRFREFHKALGVTKRTLDALAETVGKGQHSREVLRLLDSAGSEAAEWEKEEI